MDELSFCAGILEGEACFDLRKSGSLIRDPDNKHLRIIVEMKDRDIIDRLQKLFGGTAVEVRCPSKIKDNWSTYYKWLLTKRSDLYLCLKAIEPMMSNRRKAKIQEMLIFLERKLNETS